MNSPAPSLGISVPRCQRKPEVIYHDQFPNSSVGNCLFDFALNSEHESTLQAFSNPLYKFGTPHKPICICTIRMQTCSLHSIATCWNSGFWCNGPMVPWVHSLCIKLPVTFVDLCTSSGMRMRLGSISDFESVRLEIGFVSGEEVSRRTGIWIFCFLGKAQHDRALSDCIHTGKRRTSSL